MPFRLISGLVSRTFRLCPVFPSIVNTRAAAAARVV